MIMGDVYICVYVRAYIECMYATCYSIWLKLITTHC